MGKFEDFSGVFWSREGRVVNEHWGQGNGRGEGGEVSIPIQRGGEMRV